MFGPGEIRLCLSWGLSVPGTPIFGAMGIGFGWYLGMLLDRGVVGAGGCHVVDLVVVVPTERSPLALMKFFKVPARERSGGRVHFGEGAGSPSLAKKWQDKLKF